MVSGTLVSYILVYYFSVRSRTNCRYKQYMPLVDMQHSQKLSQFVYSESFFEFIHTTQ